VKGNNVMFNKKITIITCFSYEGNKKYMFNPQYLRSDLRRIISFSHNRIGCLLEDIYVISDIIPVKSIQDDIVNDFYNEVIKYLNELGVHVSYVSNKSNPLKWLNYICDQLQIDGLYEKIINTILPVIRTSNVIEFVSLFTKFINIHNKSHFDKILERVFVKNDTSHLFFYYTGHGVKVLTEKLRQYEICLLIPGKDNKVEYYSQVDLQNKFKLILNNVNSFIVFDCCHGEKILKFPFKFNFSGNSGSEKLLEDSKNTHIYISSTSNNQTCGFYSQKGSLFTYYLINLLNSIEDKCHLQDLKTVEDKIQRYRKIVGKFPQNISISTSHQHITHLPSWLFENTVNLLVENDN
jgi:hypothetical protein